MRLDNDNDDYLLTIHLDLGSNLIRTRLCHGFVIAANS